MTQRIPDPKSSAVAVVAPMAPMVYDLAEFPRDQFNQLVPTEAIRVPTDLLVPVVQIVRLSPAEADKDTYKSNDIPAGHRAPTARGLSKLATAAGISFFNERRVDDGGDPDVMRVSVDARMLLPTGQQVTATGTKEVNLRNRKWSSPAERDRYKANFYEHVATRARNRAIRSILSLKQAYTDDELRRPFAVVSFAPNMNHPLVQQLYVERMAPALEASFGLDAGSPKRLVAGGDQQLVEAPDDDVIEGQSRPADEEPPHAGGEPDWAAGAFDAAAPETPRILEVLRAKASASGLAGGVTDPQKQQLQSIFRPLGLELTLAGLRAAFGLETLAAITAAQAQAVIETARSEDFAVTWSDAFGRAAA